MKSFSSYTKDALTQLFNESGAFFAFSQQQYEEKIKEGVVYCSLGGGLFSPKESASSVVEGIANISKKGVEQDLAENGQRAIIKRELAKNECFYTRDVTDCVEALEGYGIEKDEILSVYRDMLANDEVDF